MKAIVRKRTTRQGFTLIELVVVLLVLAGLAGILVPVVQNMVTKTHGAAGAANANEAAKAIMLYEAQYGTQPNSFDSLIDTDNAPIGNIGSADLTVLTLTEGTGTTLEDSVVNSLLSAGISAVNTHNPDSTNLTFEPGYTSVTIGTAGTRAASVSADGQAALGLSPTVTFDSATSKDIVAYVAFGIGSTNTAIGRTMIEAPVHFPEAGENPSQIYSRLLAIYAIPLDGPARLATVCAAHEEGLSSLGTHLAEYYETQN